MAKLRNLGAAVGIPRRERGVSDYRHLIRSTQNWPFQSQGLTPSGKMRVCLTMSPKCP
jgi:hypothetical protein